MLAFLGDSKALTTRKSVACIIPKNQDTLIKQSVGLIKQSLRHL